MIPIECPKCGREGNVPPDRLNAKLTCRGCQAVFHLDNTGRMVMGAPGEAPKEKGRPHVQYSKPSEAMDLAEVWAGVPMAVRIGVPVVLLGIVAWQFLSSTGGPGYRTASEQIIRGLISNDRSRVVSYGSSSGADAAGKWFDVMHPLVEKQGIPGDAFVNPELFSGNPEKDSTVIVAVVLVGNSPSSTPLTLNLPMVRDGGSWRLDGPKAYSDAEKIAASAKK